MNTQEPEKNLYLTRWLAILLVDGGWYLLPTRPVYEASEAPAQSKVLADTVRKDHAAARSDNWCGGGFVSNIIPAGFVARVLVIARDC